MGSAALAAFKALKHKGRALDAVSEELPAWKVLHGCDSKALNAVESQSSQRLLENSVFVLRLRVGVLHSSTKTSSLSAFSIQALFI